MPSGTLTPERKLSDANALKNLKDDYYLHEEQEEVTPRSITQVGGDFKRLRRMTKESAKQQRKVEVLSALTSKAGEYQDYRGGSSLDGTSHSGHQ